eukprot:9502014-Pyramimonas_sp.AAC.1
MPSNDTVFTSQPLRRQVIVSFEAGLHPCIHRSSDAFWLDVRMFITKQVSEAGEISEDDDYADYDDDFEDETVDEKISKASQKSLLSKSKQHLMGDVGYEDSQASDTPRTLGMVPEGNDVPTANLSTDSKENYNAYALDSERALEDD